MTAESNASTAPIAYGRDDGDHHKAYAIDQMVRILAGDRYEGAGDDGPDTYEWDVGSLA